MATNRVSPKKGKVVDIPTAPTVGTATAGAESATVALTASTIGGAATTFTALSNPGSITGTGSSSPVTVEGLTAGTAYTFTVRGNNATGSSEYSSASNSITALTGPAFESIATVTLTGTASTFTFTSIPSTYTHLQIRGIALGNSTVNAFITFNGDTATNYNYHWVGGDGTNASINAASSTNQIVGLTSGFVGSTTIGAASIMDILDYASTNKYKTLKAINGYDGNQSHAGYIPVTLSSGFWRSTSAITSITITVSGGYNWLANSKMALYGIKG